MPAVSKAQQKFMGMVHAAQKGDMENPSPEVAKAADSMSDTDAKDFASTPHKGLPDRIKEIVLSELRSVRAIQTDYSNVVDDIQKHLELYKKSKGTPEEKKHIEHLKSLNDKKKKLAAELNDKVSDMYKDAELKVDEMSTSDGAGPYNTPFAFGKGEDEKKKGKRQADLTGYSVVNEAKTYKKGDKLKIKLPNGKKFDVVFVDYSRTKGVALGKFKDGSGEYDTKPFSLDSIVESVNEASKPTIKVVNKLKNEQGIQIVVVKTTKGETEYGGFVVRGKFQKVIPVGANKTKEDVKKRALQIWDEFGKQLGETVNEAIRNTPAKTGKELADFVLRWYDFYTNYIDDGGQRRRAIKSNEDISEWFDSHPIDLKKDAFKIIKSKMGSSNSSELQRVFGKSVSDK